MSYLLNKKLKKKKIYNIALAVVLLFALFYFGKPIARGFSYVATVVFKPVLVVGHKIGDGFSSLGTAFVSKRSLVNENANLKLQLEQIQTNVANYNALLSENDNLKEILGRKREGDNMLLASVLAKPNESPYDTLIIDVGEKQGVIINQRVFAYGNIPIGKVAEVYPSSSKVLLYSNPGEHTEVVVSGKNVYLEAVGRGGGNFEIILPKDFSVDNGTDVVLPGIVPRVVATVVKTLTDPRDTYVKALLASPANIQTLKFVEVEK